MFNYDSVKDIKDLLESHNISMRKGFGQNFMIQKEARQNFVRLLPDMVGRQVWEIGPGIGALSIDLIQAGMTVRAFELDRGFVACLQELLVDEIKNGTLTLVEGDVRKTLFRRSDRPAAIVGSLPYNIASGLLARLIARGFVDLPMVFTFQKEVVDRMCAQPGDSMYGSFSILCQYAMKVENCGVLSPQVFFPSPAVDSVIVRLRPQIQHTNTADQQRDLRLLESLLAILFRSRRKTIMNNIRQFYSVKQAAPMLACIQHTGIDMGLRAEKLSVEDFRKIIVDLSAQQIMLTPSC